MNISTAFSASAFSSLPALSSRRDGVSHGIVNPRVDQAAGAIPATDANPTPNSALSKRVSPLSPVEETSASARSEQEKVRADAEQAVAKQRQAQEEKLIQTEIKTLAARDREVRAHEQAHMAAGGQYAGAATYEYQRGPNGVNYAVGGEVPISTSEEATPEATLRKAQIIRRAALAPAEPSPQDRRVAAMATQMESAARAEIVLEREQVEQTEALSADVENEEVRASSARVPDEKPSTASTPTESASDRLQQRIYRLDGSESRSTGTLLSLMA